MGPRHRHGNEPGKEQRGRIWTPRDEQAGGRALRSLGLPRQQCTGRTGDLWLRSQVDVAKSRQHDHEGEMGELTEPVPRRGPHVHPARGSETVGRVLLRLSLGRCSQRPVAGGSRRRPSSGTDGTALSSPRRTAFLPFQRRDTEAQHARHVPDDVGPAASWSCGLRLAATPSWEGRGCAHLISTIRRLNGPASSAVRRRFF